MFEALFVALKRVRLDDLRDARREGRHHAAEINVAVAAGQVIVPPYLFCRSRTAADNAQMSVIAPNPGDWTVPVGFGVPSPEVPGWR